MMPREQETKTVRGEGFRNAHARARRAAAVCANVVFTRSVCRGNTSEGFEGIATRTGSRCDFYSLIHERE